MKAERIPLEFWHIDHRGFHAVRLGVIVVRIVGIPGRQAGHLVEPLRMTNDGSGDSFVLYSVTSRVTETPRAMSSGKKTCAFSTVGAAA
jgi:hypothetical protein